MSTPQVIPTVKVFDYEVDPTGAPLVGWPVEVTLTYPQASSTNPVVNLESSLIAVGVTDANGYWSVQLAPNNKINPSNTVYAVNVKGYRTYQVSVTDVGVPGAGWQSSAIRVNTPAALGVAGYTLPPGVTASGSLAIKGPDPWYDIMAYGGVGNGVASDMAAWTAVSAAAAATGGTILLPGGYNFVATGANGFSVPAGVTVFGPGSTITNTAGTALTIAGNCKLRSVTAVGGTANGQYGIQNPSYNVDALDCSFSGFSNRLGDTGASTYTDCTATTTGTVGAQTGGSFCWSSSNVYQNVLFTGNDGADVKGGTFIWCRMIGNGDGVTTGDGWGIHMPLTTTNPPPIFDHCLVRGNGTAGGGAYAVGLGDGTAGQTPIFRFCDIQGVRWGIYYRSNSTFDAFACRIAGTGTNAYGIEFNKDATAPHTGTGNSYAQHCVIQGNPYDLAVPTTNLYGTLTLRDCVYGTIYADDGGAAGNVFRSTFPELGKSNVIHQEVTLFPPNAYGAGDLYTDGGVATYPILRQFNGSAWLNALFPLVGTLSARPSGPVQPTGYLYFDTDLDAYVVRDSAGLWRPLGTSKSTNLALNSATPSVTDGVSFNTNSSAPTTITNFTGGVDGQMIYVRAADTNTTIQHNNTTIVTALGANLALKTANRVVAFVNNGGVWFQVGTATSTTLQLALNSATPSVAGATSLNSNSSNPTTITNFTGGVDGQVIWVRGADSNTTVQHNGVTILNRSGANFTMVANTVYGWINNAGVWFQLV